MGSAGSMNKYPSRLKKNPCFVEEKTKQSRGSLEERIE